MPFEATPSRPLVQNRQDLNTKKGVEYWRLYSDLQSVRLLLMRQGQEQKLGLGAGLYKG